MAGKQTAVMRKLISICRMHRTFCESAAHKLDLHRSQNLMLSIIANEKEAVSQIQIAKKLEISPAAASVMIKKLVSEGYCEKSFEEKDNRKNNIKITAKGLQTVKKTHEFFSQLDKKLFDGLEDKELEQLEVLLEKTENRAKQMLKEEKL